MMAINQQTFRDAMACVGAAVNIITTDGDAGRGVYRQRRVQRHRFTARASGLPESRGIGLAGV
jgi:hypothetical protein